MILVLVEYKRQDKIYSFKINKKLLRKKPQETVATVYSKVIEFIKSDDKLVNSKAKFSKNNLRLKSITKVD